jgi:hypothetical protein
MAVLYPEVGMSGTLTALTPFDQIVVSKVRYECVSVESLKGILAAGEDAYTLYYKPYNLTQEKFQTDLVADVKLITLQSYKGQYLKVPSSYLSGLPDPSGVLYSMMALSVAISALPQTTDLTALKSDISDLVASRLGVMAEVKELTYGPVTMLSTSQHHSIMQARTEVMTDTVTNLVNVRRLTAEVAALQEKLTILQNYIQTHYVPA